MSVSIYLSIYINFIICICIYIRIYLSMCISIYPSIHASTSISTSICLAIILSICYIFIFMYNEWSMTIYFIVNMNRNKIIHIPLNSAKSYDKLFLKSKSSWIFKRLSAYVMYSISCILISSHIPTFSSYANILYILSIINIIIYDHCWHCRCINTFNIIMTKINTNRMILTFVL